MVRLVHGGLSVVTVMLQLKWCICSWGSGQCLTVGKWKLSLYWVDEPVKLTMHFFFKVSPKKLYASVQLAEGKLNEIDNN